MKGPMNAPPDYVIERARLAATCSPCAKSKRGVALFNPGMAQRAGELGMSMGPGTIAQIVASVGFNGPPEPFG